jgi:ribonuclease G
VNTELVIQSAKDSINIAVLKDGRLIGLHQLPLNQNTCSVFDIYLARVKRVASSLNAAFVDIGHDKDAFLHYHDLGPYFKSSNNYVLDTIKKQILKIL